MEPAEALADLQEISPEVEAAVLLDESGAVVASTLADDSRSREIARTTARLLETADDVRARRDEPVTQLEVALLAGSVFAVRGRGRDVVAITGRNPAAGLILYDLRVCLRSIGAEAEAGAAAEAEADPGPPDA